MLNKIKDFLLHNKTTRQTIMKNFFWLTLGQFGSRFIRAIIVIYGVRALSVQEYGIFSYAMSLFGFFMLFSDIGISALLTRAVTQKPKEQEYYFATSLVIKIFLLLITICLILFIAPAISKIEAAVLLLSPLAFMGVFESLREFFVSFFRGKEKMELDALIIIISNVTLTIFGFIIFSISQTAQAFVTAYLLSSACGFAVIFFFVKDRLLKIFSYFRKNLVLPILKSAFPFAFGSMLGILMFDIDNVMMGWWRKVEEIGYYGAAQRIVGILTIFSGIIATVVFPVLSRLVTQGDKNKLKLFLERVMTINFLLAVPLVVGGILVRKSLIILIFGANYLPAVNVFSIIINLLLISYPLVILSSLVFAYDKQAKFVGYTAAAALTNTALDALLIPRYGAVGSGIATIAAQLVAFTLTLRFAKKLNEFHVLAGTKKIILAAILMGVLTFMLEKTHLNVVLNIIISAGFYFILLSIFGESVIKNILARVKKILT